MNDILSSAVASRGVRMVGKIHYSHGVKAVAAFMHLRSAFPQWSEAFWHQVLRNAAWFEEPTVDQAVQVPELKVSVSYAKSLLSRAVVPAAYQAIREWARLAGLEAIVLHYLPQACEEPENLGHRLSVLLSFLDASPIYQEGPESLLFLDRFTEFLLACKFSLSPLNISTDSASLEQALLAAAQRPGFFAHHLIVLAWALRFKSLLGESLSASVYAWVVQCSKLSYENEADKVEINSAAASFVQNDSLQLALEDLLRYGKSNIHLITLADALTLLWKVADSEVRSNLLAVASHYRRP